MIVHDELYILLGGSRRKIEIPNPSGISLKFQSNMFNDLSKFCASYSYTFKIPKTANNIEAFDLVDDIRHHSSAYGKKIECEFYRDGIKLFDNSFLYVNECGKSYSAVMTWNVLSWLLEVNESGKSIKDIEKELSGSQMTTIDFNEDRSAISNAQNMAESHVCALFRCGTPFVTIKTPKVVPVRYLLDRISRYFGKGDATDLFSFLRSTPITNTDFSNAETSFNIADDGAIPMVNGKWSNNYLQTQIRRSDKFLATKNGAEFPMLDIYGNGMDSQSKSDVVLYLTGNKQFLYFGDISGATDYVRFYKHTGTAIKTNDVHIKDKDGNDTTQIDWNNTTWTKDETANGMFMGFSSVNRSIPIILRGRVRMTDYAKLVLIPFVRANYSGQTVYTPILDDDGNKEEVIEVESTTVEGSDNLYELNFDPEQGGTEIEIEEKENVAFWVMQIDSYTETFIVDGYIKFFPNRENLSFAYQTPNALNVVDLFYNLPDIKIIDLLKSLFFIENAYPFIEKDGRIGQMRYDDLYKNIAAGDIYDWSEMLVGSQKDDSVKYTNGNLGRINRFNMKNYSSASNSDEETSLKYETASSFFLTDNETLSAENTIFTFPFSSAAKVTKNGFSAGDTFIFWEYDQDKRTYKVAGSVDPIIGRVRSYSEGHYWKSLSGISVHRALKFDIWQVANKDYDNSILAQIFKKPYVIETKVNLDTFTLSTMDFTRPVYLSRYNAYFGIISVQCDSKGMSKAELIKLPMIDQFEMRSKEDPEIKISGSPVVYKKRSSTAIAKYNIESSVVGSRINRMVVCIDGNKIVDEDIESLTFSVGFDYGTHVVSVMVTSVDGRSKTELYETRVDYAAEKASIDFIQYSNYLHISKTQRNVATFKVALYNTTATGGLRVYKYRRGTTEKVLLGSTTEKTLEVKWEYFDQLETDGIRDVNWVLSAEFNGNGESAITTKDVLVSVDRNMLNYYYGVASGMYFMIVKSNQYKVGSYIEEAFKYGDFSASYMVVGANVFPYFVEIKFLCYTDSGGQFLYIYPIDPYDGYSKYITLAKSQFGSYKRIKVTAEAWYYDQAGTHFISGDIWLYRDKQN